MKSACNQSARSKYYHHSRRQEDQFSVSQFRVKELPLLFFKVCHSTCSCCAVTPTTSLARPQSRSEQVGTMVMGGYRHTVFLNVMPALLEVRTRGKKTVVLVCMEKIEAYSSFPAWALNFLPVSILFFLLLHVAAAANLAVSCCGGICRGWRKKNRGILYKLKSVAIDHWSLNLFRQQYMYMH